MTSRTSKTGAPKTNSRITSFFQPVQHPVSHGTNTVVAASSPPTRDNQLLGAITSQRLNSPMGNLRSGNSSPATQASEGNSFSDASIPSSSMPGSQDTSKQARVIPSSDGEDESEDSDGLEDPQKMFSKLRRKNSAADPAPAIKKKGIRPRSLVRAAVVPKAMEPPTYRFSLDSLVAEKARSAALDQEKLRSRALFEEANKEHTDNNNKNNNKPISQSMLEDAFGEGAGKRLLAALNRKDAWRIDKSWHFYEVDKRYKKPRKYPFPKQALGSDWKSGLAITQSRQQMFLSGFVRDMARAGALLPDEVYIWILDELCLEIREDLAYAYLNVLSTLPSQAISKIITESSLSRMFSLLGGKNDALDIGKEITLVEAERIDDREGNFYNTKLVTSLFGKIAGVISSNPAVVKAACVLLVRLALDVRIAKEAEVRSSIEDSLAELFDNISDGKWSEVSQEIALNLINTIVDAPYRLRVLNALPVHTPRIHLFRRRLALSYIFDDPSYLTQPYTNLVRISRFSDLLMKPQYEINKSTEYSDLQSLISIMDIAIDDGPTVGNFGQNDAEVDVLVEDLRNMFTRIYDTNAQNLARTEAKDTLERLVFRLRFAVRVKDKTNLVVETDKGPEWVGRDGKVQSKLPWLGKGGGATAA